MRQKRPKKPPLTHFLCVPLVTHATRTVLDTSLASFKSDFLRTRPAEAGESIVDIQGVWQRAVRPVGTLHLTLGVMSLPDRSRLEEARKLLSELNITKLLVEAYDTASVFPAEASSVSSALVVSLHSLHPMQSARSTSTLYAAPYDATGRLKPFCERLRGIFMQRGLLVADDRPLKLHATIVNTIYVDRERSGRISTEHAMETSARDREVSPPVTSSDVQGDEAGTAISNDQDTLGDEYNQQQSERMGQNSRHGSNRGKNKLHPLRFDATAIVNLYRDFDWAVDFTLERVAICEMGAKKVADDNGTIIDEAYHEVAIRTLPI